jgi:hypothetical protein
MKDGEELYRLVVIEMVTLMDLSGLCSLFLLISLSLNGS